MKVHKITFCILIGIIVFELCCGYYLYHRLSCLQNKKNYKVDQLDQVKKISNKEEQVTIQSLVQNQDSSQKNSNKSEKKVATEQKKQKYMQQFLDDAKKLESASKSDKKNYPKNVDTTFKSYESMRKFSEQHPFVFTQEETKTVGKARKILNEALLETKKNRMNHKQKKSNQSNHGNVAIQSAQNKSKETQKKSQELPLMKSEIIKNFIDDVNTIPKEKNKDHQDEYDKAVKKAQETFEQIRKERKSHSITKDQSNQIYKAAKKLHHAKQFVGK